MLVTSKDVRKVDVVTKPSGTYTVLEVRSESNPNKFYRVDVTNGRCSCPAWKFSKGHKQMCKHLRALGYTPKEVTYEAL